MALDRVHVRSMVYRGRAMRVAIAISAATRELLAVRVAAVASVLVTAADNAVGVPTRRYN